VTAAGRALTCVVLAGLTGGCVASAKGLVRDERRESRRLQFSGGGVHTLDVRTLSGSIHVTGDNGSDVRVEAVTRVEADDDAALRTGLQTVKLEAEAQGATVAITLRDDGQNACGEQEWHRGPAWWDRRRYSTSTDLTLTVPRDVRVRLCTVNGDAVTVTGITGDFDVSNVNGKVVLTGMAGSGSATTVNGGIEASFTASPRAESRFKTVNGTIQATFPRDFAADLQLKTFNGGLFTDFETTALPVEPERAERSERPRYVYRQRGFTKVRVGAGGPVLTFDTLNGDVRITRAAR
jgi:hypothetical protein